MKRKSLTLAEIMIAALVLVIGVGAIFMVYPSLFEGVEVTSQTINAWNVCRQEIELLRSTSFTTLWSKFTDNGAISGPHSFLNTSQMSGVYYLEKLRRGATYIDDMLKVTVVVSVKAKNRTVGEDKNLNGILDGSEDINNNRMIDSPVALSTIITKQ